MTIAKTNDFQRGMLNGSDEGGLQIAISVIDNRPLLQTRNEVDVAKATAP